MALPPTPGIVNSEIEEDESDGVEPILFIFVALVAGALVRFITLKVKSPIPYTAVLLLVGMLFQWTSHFDSIPQWTEAITTIENIHPELFLSVFIPPLLFESALNMNFHILRREFWQAVVLAGPGVLIATGITSLIGVYIFDYGWSWPEALMFGALISATDPVAVVALLRELGASLRLSTLIEGESLLNDGTAFVFYIILLNFVVGEPLTAGQIIAKFFKLTFGGLFFGIFVGLIVTTWLSYVYDDAYIEGSITIFTGFLTFYGAEKLEVSGILSVVFLGITFCRFKMTISPEVQHHIHAVWENLQFMANTIIFVLSGVIVGKHVFYSDRFSIYDWGDFVDLFILYIGIHVARATTFALLYPIISRMGYGLSGKEIVILIMGGLRGAIGLALALLTALEVGATDEFRGHVLFHTCGIVFFTLIINGTLVRYLLHFLGMDRKSKSSQLVFRDAISHLERNSAESISEMILNETHFKNANWEAVKRPEYSRLIEEIDDDYHKRAARNKNNPTRSRLSTFSVSEEELMQEIRKRFLNTMKKFYRAQYEEGLVSQEAEVVLVEAVESALDSADLHHHYHCIVPYFRVPRWLKYAVALSSSIAPNFVFNIVIQILCEHLSVGIEVADTYMFASEKMDEVLDEHFHTLLGLQEHVFGKLKHMDAQLRHVIDRITEEHNDVREEVRNELRTLTDSYPDVTQAVETFHASVHILSQQRREVEMIIKEGMLEDVEGDQIKEVINKHLHDLRRKPFNVSLPDSKKVVEEMSFLHYLPERFRKEIISSSQEKLKDVGEHIRIPRHHIYIVTSGVVSIYVDELEVGIMKVGSVIGAYGLLHDREKFPRRAIFKAKTMVELRMLHSSPIKDALSIEKPVQFPLPIVIEAYVLARKYRLPISKWKAPLVSRGNTANMTNEERLKMERRIWKLAASTIVKILVRKHSYALTDTIQQLCEMGELVEFPAGVRKLLSDHAEEDTALSRAPTLPRMPSIKRMSTYSRLTEFAPSIGIRGPRAVLLKGSAVRSIEPIKDLNELKYIEETEPTLDAPALLNSSSVPYQFVKDSLVLTFVKTLDLSAPMSAFKKSRSQDLGDISAQGAFGTISESEKKEGTIAMKTPFYQTIRPINVGLGDDTVANSVTSPWSPANEDQVDLRDFSSSITAEPAQAGMTHRQIVGRSRMLLTSFPRSLSSIRKWGSERRTSI